MALFDPGESPNEFGAFSGSHPTGRTPAGFVAPRIDPSRGADFTLADKLAEARRLIEARGWVQATFDTPDGVCMVAALNRTHGIRYGDPLGEAARNLLCEATGSQLLMCWNDREGRTKAEVIDAFRKAEAIARGQA